jgi:hypothetical protein
MQKTKNKSHIFFGLCKYFFFCTLDYDEINFQFKVVYFVSSVFIYLHLSHLIFIIFFMYGIIIQVINIINLLRTDALYGFYSNIS